MDIPGSSRPTRTFWISIIVVAVIIVALLVFAFQQGGLLQARLLSPDSTITTEESPVDSTLEGESDESGLTVAAVCAAFKEQHITDCGSHHPDHDYECRTTEAEQVYNDCLEATVISEEVAPEVTPEITEDSIGPVDYSHEYE